MIFSFLFPYFIHNYCIFLFIHSFIFLKNDGISKSFDELDASCEDGIEFIFLSHALLTISPTGTVFPTVGSFQIL